MSVLKKNSSMAFSDDYKAFLKADKDQRTGKLLMMD